MTTPSTHRGGKLTSEELNLVLGALEVPQNETAVRDHIDALEAELERRDRELIEAEAFDRRFGLQLPGDAALSVLLLGAEERQSRRAGSDHHA